MNDDNVAWTQCLHVGRGSVPEYARIRARGTDVNDEPVSLDLIACAYCTELAVETLKSKIQDDTLLSLLVEEVDHV